MALPRRTFTADEGQPSTGAAGPDAIEYDLDNAFAMFNPMATLRTGEPGGIDANENIRNVQVDQNQKPDADTGKIPALLSGIVNRIKAIMGTPDWKNDPPTTLAGLANQIGNVTVNQNATPQGDTGNVQQLLSWIVNRIRAITGRGDWKEDPAVNLQVLSEAATHEDISYHALSKTTHGVQSPYYIAKTSRPDQLPSWNDIPDKPTTFPVGPHQHSAQDIITGQLPPERIGNLPASKITTGQFDPDRIPNLPASKITSGTFDRARLPAASTSQPGIVQLTNSRSSNREDLAVTAAALNAHRTSADHDDRYPTRAELNQLLSSVQWMQPGDTVLAEALASRSGSSVHRKAFIVPNPGRYRITGEIRIITGERAIVRVEIGIVEGLGDALTIATFTTTNRSGYVPFTIDFPANFYVGPGTLIVVEGLSQRQDSDGDWVTASSELRNVRLRGVPGPALGYVTYLN